MQFLMWNFRFFVSELLVWYGQLKQSKFGQPFPSEKFVHNSRPNLFLFFSFHWQDEKWWSIIC